MLCVVLLSDKHDDSPEFRWILTQNEITVWAGDVRQIKVCPLLAFKL